MQAAHQLGNGLLYGLVSVLLVVGGLSLALAESYTAPSPTPTTSLPTVSQILTSTPFGPNCATSIDSNAHCNSIATHELSSTCWLDFDLSPTKRYG